MTPRLPVVVDLDGTLSKVDTLHEQIVSTALRRPWHLLSAFVQLLSSRAAFKAKLSQNASLQTATIPWNAQVVDSLSRQRDLEVVLCTASNEAYAAKACENLEIFSKIFGSNAENNLKGGNKGAFLREKFGSRGFSYYGNEPVDLEVWKEAAKAYVVSDDSTLVDRARKVCPEVEQIGVQRGSSVFNIIRESRPHQWAKNLLVFVPLLASHRFTERRLILSSLSAFAVFCLLSSATYVLNDLLDLEADRLHVSKSKRPFAAGDLSVLFGLPLFLILAAGGMTFASFLGRPFFFSGLAYLLLTVGYSAFIKKMAMLDVYALAALYTLRLVAGGAVTGIVISVWLAAFSIFIFLSLALCKRYTELIDLSPAPSAKINRRGYYASDTLFVLVQGLVFMGCATLVLAVYLSSTAVTYLYKIPSLLWLAVVIVSFWGGRLWLLTSRQQMHDDPVFFALKDPASWACLGSLALVFFAAMGIG